MARVRIGSLSVLALAMLSATCDNLKSNVPTGPGAPMIGSVEISGPATVAPGASAQFTTSLRMTDGTRKLPSPTTPVVWRTSSNTILRVDASGLATGGQVKGTATLTAEVPVTGSGGTGGGVTRSTKEVVVLPDGTYRLVGVVRDAEYPTVLIAGARIEVNPGALVVTTDFSGRYTLYGVPPNAEVRITKDSYLPTIQNLRLNAHATQNFELPPSGLRLKLSGSYTLAIDVPGACSGAQPLSKDLQHRRYDAVVTQNALRVDVTLAEPRFAIFNEIGNRFSGQASVSSVTFTLNVWDPYYFAYYGGVSYPDVVERLPDGTALVVQGIVAATGSDAGVSGQMSGAVINWDSRFPKAGFLLGSCNAPIQFTLIRR